MRIDVTTTDTLTSLILRPRPPRAPHARLPLGHRLKPSWRKMPAQAYGGRNPDGSPIMMTLKITTEVEWLNLRFLHTTRPALTQDQIKLWYDKAYLAESRVLTHD